MDEESALTGSPITLAELKALGEFVRWQDIEARVSDLVAEKRLPDGYPLVPSRLPASGAIDLAVDGRWRQVEYLRTEGTAMSGNRRIVYLEEGREKSTRYDWFGVAPAGHYTRWNGRSPETLAEAKLLETFELAQQGHGIHSQTLESVEWPYLTFRVTSFNPQARWVEPEDMWKGSYTVHAADPRVKVEGVTSREPWFNTTIAVSHRWLSPDHPDPDGDQHRELITLAESLGLHDNQTFLIDYCSLPQQPLDEREAAWFREHLPGFQTQFKLVTLVLNTGSADYATRAWCMFELMLAAMSRAAAPTLLNHDRLDEPLREARQLARQYLQESGWNQQQMLGAFGGGVTNSTYAAWVRDPINVALYNATIDRRRVILDRFRNELDVTDPNDRPVIIELFERLVFTDF
jgi:hypothetical protein